MNNCVVDNCIQKFQNHLVSENILGRDRNQKSSSQTHEVYGEEQQQKNDVQLVKTD